MIVRRRATSLRPRSSHLALSQAIDSLEPRTLFAAALPGAAANAPGQSYDASEILVHFKQDVPKGLAGSDVLAGTNLGGSPGADHRLREVKLGKGVDVDAALAAYKKNPLVEYAEPNWVYTTQEVSDDPYYTGVSLWGMYGPNTTPANAYGSDAGGAWEAGYTGSKDVVVGIIDQGIQWTHPDLAANVWTNPNDPADGIDNDNNGYVDDIHGWDFDGNNNSVYDGTQDDHGTHVTGTIAGVGGNGAGVAGMNWHVSYISGKFLGVGGGTTTNAIKAIDYFIDLKQNHGVNIVALNNSWSGGGYSQGLLDAITRAAKANILFVAAAGNGGSDQIGDNNDSLPSYPSNYDTSAGAGYDSVVAVGAIRFDGNLSSFSNYGARTVDLAAPGEGIVSTVPTDGYATYGGTSMATPHVTGAAALYASAHPGATALQIRNALLDSARNTPTPSLAGKTATGGRLDVLKMMVQPPTAPTATGATAVSNSQINVSWVDNSTDEAGFVIERSTGTSGNWAQVGTAPGSPSAGGSVTYFDTSVIDNTTYSYRIRATNGGGVSAPSNTVTATTPTLPGAPNAPTALVATPASSSSIKLTWGDNSGNETGFVVERSASAPTEATVWAQVYTTAANTTTYTDTSRTASTAYWYRVRAINASGGTTYSSAPTAIASASTLGTGNGLTGKYYDYSTRNTSSAPATSLAFGSLKMTRIDPTVNFNWGNGSPGKGISNDTYAARWTGQIEPNYTDVYTFTAYADDGVRLWVDGKLVIDAWRINWGDLAGTTSAPLQAGQKYNIQLDYFENTQGAQIRLDWQTQGGALARQMVPKSQLYSTTSPTNTPIYSAGTSTSGPAAQSVPATASTEDGDADDIFSSSPIGVLDAEDGVLR
jgi:thermitase